MKEPHHISFPFEADPYEAKEALRTGKPLPLAQYLAGLAEGINLLAQKIESSGSDHPPHTLNATTAPSENETPQGSEFEEEWIGSLAQLEEAIEQGHEELIADYLQQASGIVSEVSRQLKGAQAGSGFRLMFKRQRKGRPKDRIANMLRDTSIRQDVAFKTLKYGKKEAAIQEVMEERGVCRTTVTRACANRPKRKSHKKL